VNKECGKERASIEEEFKRLQNYLEVSISHVVELCAKLDGLLTPLLPVDECEGKPEQQASTSTYVATVQDLQAKVQAVNRIISNISDRLEI